MASEAADQTGTLLRSVTRMLDLAANDGSGYESLIPILSLVCLVSILNRGPSPAVAPAVPATAVNPLQKLLGDLSKGEGNLGPETLMSLLPLLNNPQIKNKINPATISAVMGLMSNLGGDKSDKSDKNDKADKGDKGDSKQDKCEKSERSDKGEEQHDTKRPAPPAAAVTSLDALQHQQESIDPLEVDKKGLGRYLNWKNNF